MLLRRAILDWCACLEWDVLPEKLETHLPRILHARPWGLWVRGPFDQDYRLQLGSMARSHLVDQVWQEGDAREECYPLVLSDMRYGVLQLAGAPEAYREEWKDPDRFQFFLGMLSRSIHNALFVEKIRDLTVTDDVTGLYNSRFLHKALEKEYQRSQRYGSHFSLIFLDIDYFKLVNDNHGHLVGTDVLRETAQLILGTLRESDLATRYGGDEFVVILPETEKDESIVVARRILNKLREHVFGHDHKLKLRLTASLGVATYPTDTSERLELIRIADEAMYMVKEADRNGIATCEGIIEEN